MDCGDRRYICLEIEPIQPSWQVSYPADRGPWARFSIWVRDKNLSLNRQIGTDRMRSGVFVPLAPVADWLVRNAAGIAFEETARPFQTDTNMFHSLQKWKDAAPSEDYDQNSWDDEWFAWSERHFLEAGGDGAWLPNIALTRSDDRLWINWAPARFATPRAPTFLEEHGLESVPWNEAEKAMGEFVDVVADQLRSRGLADHYQWAKNDGAFGSALDLPWKEFASVALGVGWPRVLEIFGASTLEQALVNLGLPGSANPVDSVAMQALRDLVAKDGIGPALVACEAATRRVASENYRNARSLARDASRSGETPESEGQEAARALRDWLGLGDRPLQEPVNELSASLGIGVDESHPGTEHDFSISGARFDASAIVFLLKSERTVLPWSRYMEILRGMGHLLLDAGVGGGVVGAGSSIRSIGPRRRRSGAFAAEMTLPLGAMRQVSGGKLDSAAAPDKFRQIMEKYTVGARTAAWQLYNAGLLSSREIAEGLIERFGSEVCQPAP